MGVQMTTPARIDLNRRNAGLTNSISVVGSGLIAFDHPKWRTTGKQIQGLDQKGCLTSAGAGYQVQREQAAIRQPLPVCLGIAIILGQDILFYLDQAFLAEARYTDPRHPRTIVMIMTVTVGLVYVIVRMVTFVSLATPANGAHAYFSPNLLAFATRRMC
jgi:hypothetical protein